MGVGNIRLNLAARANARQFDNLGTAWLRDMPRELAFQSEVVLRIQAVNSLPASLPAFLPVLQYCRVASQVARRVRLDHSRSPGT